MGHHFGVPFHVTAQRRIITDALDFIGTATHSGQILDIPLRWAELRRQGAEIERQHSPPGGR
jgi:hypothetical protein